MVARREARSGAMKRGDFLDRRLALIRERVERGDYVISFTHTEKLRERKIGAEDIEEAIRNGVIIEDYPDDPRGPSGLILGRSRGRTLHVVCGRLEEEQILIITAYEPDPTEWQSDWRTRRR
jgi:hypothetical protein